MVSHVTIRLVSEAVGNHSKSQIIGSRTRLEDMLSVMWFPRLFEEAETDVNVGGLLI